MLVVLLRTGVRMLCLELASLGCRVWLLGRSRGEDSHSYALRTLWHFHQVQLTVTRSHVPTSTHLCRLCKSALFNRALLTLCPYYLLSNIDWTKARINCVKVQNIFINKRIRFTNFRQYYWNGGEKSEMSSEGYKINPLQKRMLSTYLIYNFYEISWAVSSIRVLLRIVDDQTS